MREDLSARLSWRIDTNQLLERVREGEGRETELIDASDRIRRRATGGTTGDPVWAYAELLHALAKAVPWREAIRNGDPNQDRCRPAASQRAADTLAARKQSPWWPPQLVEAAIAIRDLASPDDVGGCAAKLLAVPLPVHITGATLPERRFGSGRPSAKGQPASPVSVELAVNGKPLPTPFGMKHNAIYTVDVRVKQLPDQGAGGETLRIGFAVDLSETQHEFEVLDLPAGQREGTARLMLRGTLEPVGTRKVVEVRAALVSNDGKESPLRVIGHAKFEIMTYDPSHDAIPGLPWLSLKLDEMLADLDHRIPLLPRADRDDFIVLYRGVCKFAQWVITQRKFDGMKQIKEKVLQEMLKQYLLADPAVGHDLQEGNRLAGGAVDLILRAINLELKVARKRAVTMNDAETFMSQPAFYGSARGCPISILCILDASRKTLPPGDLTNYMGWRFPPMHGLDTPELPALVATVIIPIGFGPPHEGGKAKAEKKVMPRSAKGRTQS